MNEGFFGKFRGVVTDNLDPEMRGRVKAKVPDVLGEFESGWALPCAAFGGDKLGFFAVPTEGASVWVEFEHGDPDKPVWSGVFWSTLEIPPKLLVPPPPSKKVALITPAGHTVLLDDSPGIGGIILETAGGCKVSMTDLGIEIDNGKGGKISIMGPTVSINSGALDIT